MKILLVDDSKTVHTYIKSLLDGKGYTFDSAYDGAEAVEKSTSNEYDLIFMDIEMPKMTGLEALKAIRSLDSDTPIIMVTSKNTPSLIKEIITAGADEYIMKPFTEDIILRKMSDILNVGEVA